MQSKNYHFRGSLQKASRCLSNSSFWLLCDNIQVKAPTLRSKFWFCLSPRNIHRHRSIQENPRLLHHNKRKTNSRYSRPHLVRSKPLSIQTKTINVTCLVHNPSTHQLFCIKARRFRRVGQNKHEHWCEIGGCHLSKYLRSKRGQSTSAKLHCCRTRCGSEAIRQRSVFMFTAQDQRVYIICYALWTSRSRAGSLKFQCQ